MKTDEILEDTLVAVEERLRWNKLVETTHLQIIFEMKFKFNNEKLVYKLSNNKRSIHDLEKNTGVVKNQALLLWRKWHNTDIEKFQRCGGKLIKKIFSITCAVIETKLLPKYQTKQKVKGNFG